MKSIAKNSPNKKVKISRQYLNLVVIREELCYLEDLIVSPSCWIWTILKIMTFNTGQGAESLTTDGPMGIEYSYPRPIRWAPHRGGCIIPLWLCPLRWAYLGDAERSRVEDQNIVEDEFQDLLSGATGLRILINRTVFTTVESGSLLCLRIRFSLSADTWDGSDINFPGPPGLRWLSLGGENKNFSTLLVSDNTQSFENWNRFWCFNHVII